MLLIILLTKEAQVLVIYEFDDYKNYVRSVILDMPKRGRGQYKLLGEYLNVGSVVISQIFNSDKDLTHEQAFLCAEFLGLNELEREYFLTLVSYSRAAHFKLKEYHLGQLKELKKRALELSARMKNNNVLSDEAKQTFYSDWSYSAISLSTCLDSINTPKDIADYLKIDVVEVKGKLNFLESHKIVIKTKDGLKLGSGTTYLDKKSPLLNTHRKNWRIKAMEDLSRDNSMFLVAPLCLSKRLKEKLHTGILDLLNEVLEEMPKEDAEELVCLNVDLFSVS